LAEQAPAIGDSNAPLVLDEAAAGAAPGSGCQSGGSPVRLRASGHGPDRSRDQGAQVERALRRLTGGNGGPHHGGRPCRDCEDGRHPRTREDLHAIRPRATSDVSEPAGRDSG